MWRFSPEGTCVHSHAGLHHRRNMSAITMWLLNSSGGGCLVPRWRLDLNSDSCRTRSLPCSGCLLRPAKTCGFGVEGEQIDRCPVARVGERALHHEVVLGGEFPALLLPRRDRVGRLARESADAFTAAERGDDVVVVPKWFEQRR